MQLFSLGCRRYGWKKRQHGFQWFCLCICQWSYLPPTRDLNTSCIFQWMAFETDPWWYDLKAVQCSTNLSQYLLTCYTKYSSWCYLIVPVKILLTYTGIRRRQNEKIIILCAANSIPVDMLMMSARWTPKRHIVDVLNQSNAVWLANLSLC